MDNVNDRSLRFLRPALPWLLTVGGLACHPGTADCSTADSPPTTWPVGHAELLPLFGRPFSMAGMQHRKNRFQPWRSEIADALYPLANAATRTHVRTRTRQGAASMEERLVAAVA